MEKEDWEYRIFLRKRKEAEHAFLHVITREEFLEVMKAEVYLKFANENERAWRILYVNLKDNANFGMPLMKEAISKDFVLSKDNLELIERVLNVQLFNILSAFYFYYEFCKTQFSRLFGKESEQVEKLKSTFSYFFDNHFEYRFFYKLRNYVVHCGLPIQSVFNGLDEGENKSTLGIQFDAKYLLNNYDGWGKVVEKDLEEKEVIPVMTTIINFSEISINLHKKIKEQIIEETIEARKKIREICKWNDFDNTSIYIRQREVRDGNNQFYEIPLTCEIIPNLEYEN